MQRFTLCLLGWLLGVIIATPVSAQQNFQWKNTPRSVPFTWSASENDPHAAMLIPITDSKTGKQLFLQFDTGVMQSVLYNEQGDSVRWKLGNYQLLVLHLPAKQLQHDGKIAGTLGLDFIQDYIVEIDYPACKINFKPRIASNLQWSSLTVTPKGLMLPAKIRGQQTQLFFDSGSSAFPLVTDEETFATLALNGKPANKYTANSWGRTLDVYTAPTNDSILLGGKLLPILTVAHIAGASEQQVAMMKKIGIGGLTGNKLFLQQRLLLDIRGKRFAIQGK
ncbi:hypothetical protein LX64_04125 [Chitinophaga skermanii]|uniref:Aspartyl protease n=1 Tax=Chitinophaga skermanii TaxID=331697 RepID=A0A327Q7E5_9BACT|nr:hypothetical protein [Chitinophaga skermanii]RAJ00419.1 hypothetical protein LX64_04125 [Chitinophaga skermanii]